MVGVPSEPALPLCADLQLLAQCRGGVLCQARPPLPEAGGLRLGRTGAGGDSAFPGGAQPDGGTAVPLARRAGGDHRLAQTGPHETAVAGIGLICLHLTTSFVWTEQGDFRRIGSVQTQRTGDFRS